MNETIRTEILRYVATHPGNRLEGEDSPYFDAPLVGFARAADPLFAAYRQVIGPFHLTPGELLPDAASVICWVLPISRAVRESNRRETALPSRAWALTRTHGEALNGDLRRHLVAWLQERGHAAIAPQYAPQWREYADTPVGIASSWSERHAAYAAGLGTFSLSDGFITPAGIAHRLGSVVTTLSVSPSPRPFSGPFANCLHFHDGSCGACIGRCPVAAISRAGHDKGRCRALVYNTAPQQLAPLYGVPQTGCGLCQTRVPCEEHIPPACRSPRTAI